MAHSAHIVLRRHAVVAVCGSGRNRGVLSVSQCVSASHVVDSSGGVWLELKPISSTQKADPLRGHERHASCPLH
jgi:hypothetical protein